MPDNDDYGLRDYLDIRFSHIEQRLDRIEGAGPRAGMWGGIGTAIGAAVVFVISFFSPKQ